MYLKLKVTNFFKTVASPVTWSHISFVNVLTTKIRGMVAVCFVIMTFTLITVWMAEQNKSQHTKLTLEKKILPPRQEIVSYSRRI